MRYSVIIAVLFCFIHSCSDKVPALSDDYVSVSKRLTIINMSHRSLQQRQSETFDLLKRFISQYKASENSLVLLASASNLSAEQYSLLYGSLDANLRTNPYWSAVDLTGAQIKAAETGKPFPTITFYDTLNSRTNLKALRGKIVFLDFWSSWCTSCREQFPHLKLINSAYKSKGLEIIGISMDQTKELWLGALKKEDLPWRQFCELKPFQENSLAKKFHIKGIPANFLIDKEGTLIGQNLSPEEFEVLLSRL